MGLHDERLGCELFPDLRYLKLGVGLANGLIEPMILRNTLIPTIKSRTFTFTTAAAHDHDHDYDNDQKSGIEVRLFEGERALAAASAVRSINIKVELRLSNRNLEATVRNVDTGHEETMVVPTKALWGFSTDDIDILDRFLIDADENWEQDNVLRELPGGIL